MKKKLLSLILSAVTLFSSISTVSAAEITLWKNASDWAVSELNKAQSQSLIPAILNNQDFTQKATRAEFAAVAVKVYEALAGKAAQAPAANPFTDTSDAEILKAYNLGITTGVSTTEFAPDNNLTREQAATMLSRSYTKAYSLSALPAYTKPAAFADDAEISSWANEFVYFMAGNNIINGVGDNKFAPKNTTSREQALLIAVRIVENLKKEQAEKPVEPPVETKPVIYNVEPDPIVSDKGASDFVIGYIGGSLTEDNNIWIPQVTEFYQKKMPKKNVIAVEAGIGGTGSAFGALRFRKDILAHEPDLIFIEFPVNDRHAESIEKVYGMESMIRQCLELDKVPNIIILFTPMPAEKDTEPYKLWNTAVKYHTKIANHYGLKTINIYDYMYAQFEAGSKKRFNDYLDLYYQKYADSDEYNVHAGYSLYAEAILEALEKDFDKYNIAPKKKSTYVVDTEDTRARFKWTYATSERFQYDAKWKLYKSDPGLSNGQEIPGKFFNEGFFPEGIYQTTENNSSVMFKSTPGADAFCLSYVSSLKGCNATVTIDGKKYEKKLGTNVVYGNVNYTTNWIELPYDGKSHTIKITVDEIDGTDHTVFRFGALIERYKTE